MEKKVFKVKAHIDLLKDRLDELGEKIFDSIPSNYDDDVWEFYITIDRVKDLTDEVGVNSEGGRAYEDVEVEEVQK